MRKRIGMSGIALAAALATGAVLSAPQGASAQSELDTSQAEMFLGNWTLAFDSDVGPFEMGLALTDADGKLAAEVSSPDLGSQEITTASRTGESLVLSYTMDAQGMPISASISLTPNGDSYRASMDFADGAFMMNGTATRAES